MNNKGLFEFVGGMFFGIVILAIIVILSIYLFGPKLIPSTPCIVETNCHPQKVCCTWRCDSKDLSFWKCPEEICQYIGNEEITQCRCSDFQCVLP